MVVAEAAKGQKQVHDARRHFAQPRFVFRQQFAAFLQASGFKAGVVCHHRTGFGQVGAELAHEFRAGIRRAFGEKLAMVEPRLGTGLADDMQGILKWHLLVGFDAVKQRDGRADGLEIQVADGIFELAEKRGERGAVNVRLAGEQGGALDGLIVGERDVGGNIRQFLDALLEQGEAFRTAAIKREDAGFGQERPAAVVQRTGIWIIALRADLNIGMRLGADDALHGVDLVLDVAAQGGDRLGDIFEGEKLLRVNRALPDKLVIDVGEETFAEFDARAGEDERLERDVGQMDILL